ncbi:hypothetical protein HDU83_005604 [Entophlyctis luteolus]|nr:hypothetical protein HDU83_005604 [Entophlyctis luteolus]
MAARHARAAAAVVLAAAAHAQTATASASASAAASSNSTGTACATDADCLGIGGSCYFGTCTVIINCSLTTLGQCGNDFATVIKQPLIIGLIILGCFVLCCCLPSILCCFFRKLLCFAIKAPVRVVGASAKAVSAVSNMGTIKRSAAGGRTANTAGLSPSSKPGGNKSNTDMKINVGGGVTGGRTKKTTFSTYNAYSAYKSMDRGAGRNATASGNGMSGSPIGGGVGPGRAKQYARLDEVVVDGGSNFSSGVSGGGGILTGGYPTSNTQRNVRQDYGQRSRMNSNTSGGSGSMERDRNGNVPRYPPSANVAVTYTQNGSQPQINRQNGAGTRPYPGGSGPRAGSMGRM